MKYIGKARQVFTVMGVVAALALGMGWMTPSNTVEAGPKAFGLPQVYSFSWGVSNTGSMFATMHKTGEVNTDPISFNFGAKVPTPVNLGPGHGTWKYNANTNKVTITTFHNDRDGSGKYWKVVQSTTPDSAGTLTGSVKISQFAAIGDSEPEAFMQALCTNEVISGTIKF